MQLLFSYFSYFYILLSYSPSFSWSSKLFCLVVFLYLNLLKRLPRTEFKSFILNVKHALLLPKPVWSKLGSLGFALSKLHATRHLMDRHLRKSPEMSSLGALIDSELGKDSQTQSATGLFASEIAVTGSHLQIRQAFIDELLLKKLSEGLQAASEAESETASIPIAPVPHHGNSPVWSALIRLRPLQEFWERELRRNHWELLIETLPGAWLMDPNPLPPQAVIPRLEIGSWSHLTQMHGTGRVFEISAAWQPSPHWLLSDSANESAWESAMGNALAVAARGTPLVVEDRTTSPDAQSVIAFYHKSEKRVEMTGAYVFTQDASGNMTMAPVMRE